MKKTFIAFAILVMAVTSNAQVFVGGGLGVDYMGGKYKGGSASFDLPSGFAFSFAPKVGFFLNDDFAIGLEVEFLSATLKEPGYGTNAKDNKYKLTVWGVSGFARRNLVGTDKFALLLEGSLGVGGLKTKETIGSASYDGDPTFMFAVGVQPVLSYSVTDRLSVEAACNFLRFGFQSATTKDADNSNEKTTVNTFGFGVNSSTISLDNSGDMSFSNPLTIGLVFRF